MTRRAGRHLVLALCAVACGAAAGCASDPTKGYAFGSAHRQDIRTVAVPMFDNTTFSHGLEAQLTDAVITEVHRTTPWRVAPAQTAETALTGTITGASLRRLSRQQGTGLAQELAVELTVSFEWKDARTGEILVSRRGFRSADTFTPAQGVEERLELGQRGAIDRLAKDMVAELRSSW